jgi:PilZ domain
VRDGWEQGYVGIEDLFEQAAATLVSESTVEMATDDGALIEVWTISQDGVVVHASAARLVVREGMALSCRLQLDGIPHRVVVVIDEAVMRSQARAALVLRVNEVVVDGMRRASERFQLALSASLTALICDRLVPGVSVGGILQDISEGGLALSVADLRPRPNDRYRLQIRFFEGPLDCEIRVLAARPAEQPGTQTLGCAFLAPSAQTESTIGRVIARMQTATVNPTTGNIRASLGINTDATPTTRRSLRTPTTPRLA